MLYPLLRLPPPPRSNCHPQTATHQLSPTNCHQAILTNQLPPTKCHQPTATDQLPPTNCHQQTSTNQLPRMYALVLGSPPLCRCDLRGRRSTWWSPRGRIYALLLGRRRCAGVICVAGAALGALQPPPTSKRQPTTTNHQPPTNHHQPPITTNHQPPPTTIMFLCMSESRDPVVVAGRPTVAEVAATVAEARETALDARLRLTWRGGQSW